MDTEQKNNFIELSK